MVSRTNTDPVVVDRVTKMYHPLSGDVTALDDVSLRVRAGEMIAIVGPSGCGKTTLLNLIGCLDQPTHGTVTIDGHDIAAAGERARTRLRRDRVGSVFQFFNLLAGLTIAANVGVPLVLQHLSEHEAALRIDAALERVGISNQSKKYPDELSGGQQQRAAIARAIVHRPAIVIADEPTGNLDAANAARTIELFRALAGEGETIVLATHSADVARACDRTISMHDGRIV